MFHQPRPLPEVTIVIIDNVEVELSRMALARTLKEVRPAAVHVWSNKDFGLEDISVPYTQFDAELKGICAVEEVLWREVPKEITTSHMLIMQWDGWVINGNKWSDEFLNYDYIGAPWPWYDFYRVGNGGFSLRSTKLMRELATFDIVSSEDSSICRFYRQDLEKLGYRWAPEALAQRFAYEHGRKTDSFGFHGAFNFPGVLPPDEFVHLVSRAGCHATKGLAWSRMLGVVRA